MKLENMIELKRCLTLILIISMVVCKSSSKDLNGIPLGAIIDKQHSSELEPILTATLNYLNNQIDQNNWFMYLNKLSESNMHEIMRSMCNQMHKGVLAVLADHNSPESVKSFANLNQIPVLTAKIEHGFDAQKSAESFLLNAYPDTTALFISLIKKNNWKNIIYYYNHEEGLVRVKNLLEHQLTDSKMDTTNIVVNRLDDSADADQLALKSVIKTNEFNRQETIIFVDFVNAASFNRFLNIAKYLGMQKDKYHFVLVSMLVQEIDPQAMEQLRVTAFSLVDYDNLNTKSILSNVLGADYRQNKNLSINSLLVIDSLMFFHTQMNKIVGKNENRLFGLDTVRLRQSEIYVNTSKGHSCSLVPTNSPWPLGRLVINNLKNMPAFVGVTGPIVFDNNGARIKYLIDVYESNTNSPLSKVGEFSYTGGLEIDQKKRLQLNENTKLNVKTSLRIVSIQDEPFLFADSTNLSSMQDFTGYCVDLAEHIAKLLNFTYEFRLVKDNRYGYQNSDGEWTGIIGELVRDEADLAIAPLTITSSRQKAVDFSNPFMRVSLSMIANNPHRYMKKSNALFFLMPFSLEIWLCLVISYVTVSFFLFLVSRFSSNEASLEIVNDRPMVKNPFTLLNSLWFNLAAFYQQFVIISPKAVSGRLIVSVWWTFSLVVFIAYVANAGFIAHPINLGPAPIKNIQDLVDQNHIAYGIIDHGSTKEFMQQYNNPIYQKLWNNMENSQFNKFFSNNLNGIQELRNLGGNFVFITESSFANYHNERLPCDTRKIDIESESRAYGIATPIGSNLRNPINWAIIKLGEMGVLENLKSKWFSNASVCAPNTPKYEEKMIRDYRTGIVISLFGVLLTGLVLSLIVVAIETAFGKFFNKQKEQESERMHTLPKNQSNPGQNSLI